MRRVLLSGTAAVATLALAAGCGNGDGVGGMNHGEAASPTAAVTSGAVFNDADVQFAQMMIKVLIRGLPRIRPSSCPS